MPKKESSDKINLMLSIGGLHHGGAERVVASMCRNLDRERFNVTVCWRASKGEIGAELSEQGYDLVGLPEINSDVSPYLRFLVLHKLIKDRDIDIIHTHDTGCLADAAQCRLLGGKAKIIHTFHFGNYPNLKGSHLLMDRIFSRLANRLISVGFEQQKRIQQALFLKDDRIDTLYNGVEFPLEDKTVDFVTEIKDRPDRPIIIGSISTLTEQKGLNILLDAAAILKQKGHKFVVLIAGGGPLRDELEEQVVRLKLQDHVHFLGWVDRAADKLLQSFDIFCQSSLWEANSIVLLEAMCSGLPIITTDVGESRHVITSGKEGLIVNPGRSDELADALDQLIQDQSQRQAMGMAAGERFLAKYTIDRMIDKYQDEYEKLMRD